MSKADIATLLAEARLPERTVALCLRGDLQARVEELERQLESAREERAGKLSDGGTERALAEQIEAVRESMKDSTVSFTLRAMSRKAWADLVAKHPAADDDATGRALGYDPDGFFPALVAASVVSPEVTTDQWDTLIDEKLTSRQYDELVDAALALNRRPVDVPFSVAASRALRTSEQK